MTVPLRLALIAGGLAAALVAAATAAEPVDRTVELTFQGRARRYFLHVPAAPSGALVIALHGGGQPVERFRRITALDAVADREHFIVAYPEAFERSWADGRDETSAERAGIDDVGFAKAVVADIAKTVEVDRARTFAAGLSNGAILAHRIACEAADTFVAIGAVIGALAKNTARDCRPREPVAIVAIQGLADPAVSFEDNPGPLLGGRATQQRWAALNDCDDAPAVSALPSTQDDGTRIHRREFKGCRPGGDVVWYEIEGGGHRWPPPEPDAQDEAIESRENGIASRDLEASEVVWAFFAAHPRRGR